MVSFPVNVIVVKSTDTYVLAFAPSRSSVYQKDSIIL